MPMEELKEKTADLVDHVEELADTFYKLTVLNLTQKAGNLVSSAIVIILVSSLAMFAVLFGGIALSWWLGNLVESRVGGFLLGALVFVLLLGLIVALRKKTIFPLIRNIIIKAVYN